MRLKFGAIMIISLTLFSCKGEKSVKSESVKMVKCETVVSSQRNSVEREFPGKITASKDVNLSFRVAGVVDKINVVEGQFVRKNQVVAVMDNRDYKLQLEATQAEYNAIKGEVERVIALYNTNSVPANDYEKAVNGLKAITSKLEAHRNALEDTQLKAPFDGYIQKINFDKGEAVSAGMPILTFISSSAPIVKINIPTSDYLMRGDLVEATATIDLYPDMVFALKMIGTTHKANINHLYETRFSIAAQEGVTFTAGMSVMVTFKYKNSTAGEETIIPFSAIYETKDKSCVWLLKDGKATKREVIVEEITSSGMAIIASGISDGDIIITAGMSSLSEGQEVKPLPQPSKSNIGNIL